MKLPNILLSLVAAVVMTFGLSTSTVQGQGNCAGDTNGDGVVNGGDLAQVLADWGACQSPMLISSVTPISGPTLGGTAITILGSGFSTVTSVMIGGVAATNVVVVSATVVTVVTPPGTVGAKNVLVITPNSTATAIGAFTYFSIVVPAWATLLELAPDPAVVTDANLRAAIVASGFAWRVRDTASNIEMLLVPAGTFTMGCSASTAYGCESDESPTHQVTLSAFYIGRYEVTQAQWSAEMGSNPSFFVPANGYTSNTTKPVEQVSWNMIQPFCTQNGLRLPTEAEWEYAYRAGTTTAFHSFPGYANGTNDDTLLGNIAWYDANGGSQTHAVGGKFANALGLHDMSGNVWEWGQDWDGAYSSAAQTNPTGPTTGSYRLLRGGYCYSTSDYCRASQRHAATPDTVVDYIGFRVVRNP